MGVSRDRHTARYDDPDEVHEEEIEPEIIRFWSAIDQIFVVQFEEVGGVIKNVAVNLAQRDDSLERIAERVVGYDQIAHVESQRTPTKLRAQRSASSSQCSSETQYAEE